MPHGERHGWRFGGLLVPLRPGPFYTALKPVSRHSRDHTREQGKQTMTAERFKAARDFLLATRTNYPAAHAGFRWPELTEFNYALDWFDGELARTQPNDLALKISGEGAAIRTFAELSEASNSLANSLRALGVKRGERILLMLGNVVPLWETMLAAMKLGAVVIPATTLLTTNDLRDRFDRDGRAIWWRTLRMPRSLTASIRRSPGSR